MTGEERQLHLFKGKRQRGTKLPLATEFEMHCVIADSLRHGAMPGWLWTHFPAGELRTKATGARLKRMGMQPGWADFLLIDEDGRHHWMELKRGKAPLTPEQRLFGKMMEWRHVPYELVRSVPEAMQVLRDWGAIQVSLADQLTAGRNP